jgi:phosphoribosyl 1,2-cyclic phosphate phosphodiesterase
MPEGNLLIDTGPDLRFQLLREQIGIVHAVIYTHEHADHLFGLDDLRLFPFYLGHPIPLYCEELVERRIRRAFDYAFGEEYTHTGAAPQLSIRPLDMSPQQILGGEILPLRLQHGPRFEVLGFRIGNIAYCTDTNHIPGDTMAQLKGLDVLIIDALRWKPHVTHFCVEEAIAVAEQLKPKRTIFTHICHDLGHAETNARLPPGIELGYDGMRFQLG